MLTCKNGLKKRRNHAVMGERFIFIYFFWGPKWDYFNFFSYLCAEVMNLLT